MDLKTKREDWEKGGEEILVVTQMDGAYATVYVILNFDGEYALHRYFPMYCQPEKTWEVSVDCSGTTLERCLNEVTDSFKELYPTEK